jgi:hypothetical protein
MIDPMLSYYGHPILPAGYNSWDFNGDEVDGAGVNEPCWPYLFDTFIALNPFILTAELVAVFDECPDYCFRCVDDTIVFPCEPETIHVRRRA